MTTETVMMTASNERSRFARSAAWLAIVLTVITILLLAALHVLSPEFSPSWRVISEYALGRYGWVLSLMFIAMGTSSWALAVAIWPEVRTNAGKAGLWLLLVAGMGGTMASYFDIRHEIGHGIAGLLGVIGFPIAAMLLSNSLSHVKDWQGAKRTLGLLANLSWIAVLLLVGTLVIMTMQFSRVYGGHLPQHAPESLPSGVLGLDGWADRLIVLSNCAWVFAVASHALRIQKAGSESY